MQIRRRDFLQVAGSTLLAGCAALPRVEAAEPIIDIHQHTNYVGRSDPDLFAHQEAMGVTTTVLLPAGRYYGLDAQCGGNESVQRAARQRRGSYLFFANELPYLKEADSVIRTNLQKGARGIGEQKFRVLADSAYLERIAGIARDFNVPVLLHFWDGDYNMELQRFSKILAKFPSVNFIGHAQTWWGHIDKNHNPAVAYPKGKVTPGGLTDRLLADYPNMFGDLSAGSGLNALTRDPEHTVAFLQRHQDKLLFGSDCPDVEGRGVKCQGAQIMSAIRQHAGSKGVERKILYENSKKLLRL
jgi:predicted TIM-barrel fold metal-dependent hydrolase